MRIQQFSLQAPGELPDGKAEVPDWLNANIAHSNAQYSKDVLGRINLKLASGAINSLRTQEPICSRQELFTAQIPRPAPMEQDQPENFQENFDVDCFFPSRIGSPDAEVNAANKSYAQSIGQRIYLLLRNATEQAERKLIKDRMNGILYQLESDI